MEIENKIGEVFLPSLNKVILIMGRTPSEWSFFIIQAIGLLFLERIILGNFFAFCGIFFVEFLIYRLWFMNEDLQKAQNEARYSHKYEKQYLQNKTNKQIKAISPKDLWQN